MKRVLVTGSSRGIGKAVALELARAGFEVTVHGRAPSEALEEVQGALESISGTAPAIHFNVADREAARNALSLEVESRGPFYGVVCSAGIIADASFPSMTSAQWDSVLQTNLGGFFNVVQPLTLPMIRLRDGGRIVSITSISALIGNKGQVNYSASKGAITAASRSLAVELASRRISVNCVAPGPVETDMLPEALRKHLTSMIPMQRFARLDEIAATVGFLFDPRAEFITGQTIALSGGQT